MKTTTNYRITHIEELKQGDVFIFVRDPSPDVIPYKIIEEYRDHIEPNDTSKCCVNLVTGNRFVARPFSEVIEIGAELILNEDSRKPSLRLNNL